MVRCTNPPANLAAGMSGGVNIGIGGATGNCLNNALEVTNRNERLAYGNTGNFQSTHI